MYTCIPSTLMCAFEKRDDLANLWSDGRPAANGHRRMWWRIGQPAKAERSDRSEPREAYDGLFILGYGLVPGAQDRTKGLI